MGQDRKFYITPKHLLDADYIGDALYFPKALPTRHRSEIGGPQLVPQRKQSELHLTFKNSGAGISLYGDDADLAWESFKRATMGSSSRGSFPSRTFARELPPMNTGKKFA